MLGWRLQGEEGEGRGRTLWTEAGAVAGVLARLVTRRLGAQPGEEGPTFRLYYSIKINSDL